jgi:4-deoxy-L-threo-5-hexosulose-uronate ketol-isomerase
MKLVQMADRVRYSTMTTQQRRQTFLLEGICRQGEISLAYVDLDRAVVGCAVPRDEILPLETQPELRASYFCERRELGVLNVGGTGRIVADKTEFALGKLDCLYIGRGSKSVHFSSDAPDDPACFYLLSYPAHKEYPTAMIRFAEITGLELGATETCNRRTLYKAIHKDGLQSCQLVMGFTRIAEASNWNTMPPHTHMRRGEVYFYFDLDSSNRVFHLMGPPDETSHLVVANREVVISPGWSIHAGVGTGNYAFCWGMGGENQAYDDKDPAPVTDLR